MRRMFAVLVLFAALLTGAAARATTYNTADESLIQQLTNSTRAGVGVKSLAFQAGLQQMARAQAVRMAARGDIYHNPNLSADITALGVNWRMVGENVGAGPDARTVYAALLKSPHHYENIVRSNYTSLGVGEVNGTDGRIYLVQVFAEIVPAAAPVHTTAPAHAAPAPVRTVAAPAHVQATARPAVRVAPVRHPDPNALFGGLVFRSEVPTARAGRSGGFVRRLAADISAWL